MSNLTEQAIKASFIRLLNERPLTRITVGDIARDCGINRNSFYYHFHDIPELMDTIVRDHTDNLIETYPDISSLEDCVQAAFDFIVENRRAVNHIYHSVNREVFEQNLMRICSYTVESWFKKACPDHMMEEQEKQRIIRFIRFELFGACVDWINCGMPLDAIEEAKQLLLLSQQILFKNESRGQEPLLDK